MWPRSLTYARSCRIRERRKEAPAPRPRRRPPSSRAGHCQGAEPHRRLAVRTHDGACLHSVGRGGRGGTGQPRPAHAPAECGAGDRGRSSHLGHAGTNGGRGNPAPIAPVGRHFHRAHRSGGPTVVATRLGTAKCAEKTRSSGRMECSHRNARDHGSGIRFAPRRLPF